MEKKLYHAEVTYHYYFLAEEGDEDGVAKKYMKEAIRNDRTVEPDVNEVSRMEHMMDWDDHDLLVYGDEDVTLKEAFEQTNGRSYDDEKKEFNKRIIPATS